MALSPKNITMSDQLDEPGSLHSLKIVVRAISFGANFNGAESVENVEAYVGAYLSKGYEVKAIHFLGAKPEGLEFAFFLVN